MSEHSFLDVLRRAGLYRPNGHPVAVDLTDLPQAPAGDPDAARYAEAALKYECEAVQDAGEGTRNDTLNRAAFKLGSLVTAGHLDGHTVANELAAAARVSGLPNSEIDRTVIRAIRDGGSEPRVVKLEPRAEIATAYVLTPQPHPDTDLFDPPGPVPDDDTDTGNDAGQDAGDRSGTGEDDEAVAAEIAARYPQLDWHAEFAKAPEDVEWIAYPVFEAGRLYSVYSPAKAGKSLFTLDVAAALATGRAPFTYSARDPLHVLYVDMENSPTDLVERLQDFDYGPDDIAEHLHYLSFPNLPALDSARGGNELMLAAAYYQAQVVVIDTVSRTIAGKENDSDTFHALYRHAMAPLKRLGITVIRLDHSGKDEEKGMRGSSAKVSDVDVAWKLTKTGEERLRLDRTASRNSHSPEYVVIEQKQAPLQHALIADHVDGEVAQLAATLTRLGIPTDYGRGRASQLLREAGIKARNALLSEAIRYRRTTFDGGNP